LALGQALGAAPSPAEVARLAVTVEPTDSTLFPGLALFAHRDGCRHAPLGPSPPLEVLVLDPGGEVDTVRFNKADHDATLRGLSADHAEAFELLRGSLAGHDWEGMGEAATLSARAHQAILPDELGPVAWHLARDVGALGVCRAHSGTLWGVLIDPARCDVHGTFTYLLGRVPQGVDAYRERLAEGGPQRIDSSEDV
jgi:L-threonine kinase